MAGGSGLPWFITKRTIYMVIQLLIILTLIFLLFEALPLKPMDRLRLNPQIKPTQIEYVEHLYGYDKSPSERYFLYMRNMLTFNFGFSFQNLVPVWDLVAERLPRTLLLVGGSTIIAYGIGIVIGALIAWRRGGIGDRSTVVTSLFFYNMPTFWLGLILIYVFAFTYKLFPLSGFHDPNSQYPYWLDVLWHTALPLIVLTIVSLGGTILLARTGMLDVMGENYITTAYAKGLKERTVLYKHAARNAMLPVVSSFILSFVFSVGGAIITESVFSYEGIGLLFIRSLTQLDYPVCMATTYIISMLVVVGNFVGDLIYAWLDPRVRLQ